MRSIYNTYTVFNRVPFLNFYMTRYDRLKRHSKITCRIKLLGRIAIGNCQLHFSILLIMTDALADCVEPVGLWHARMQLHIGIRRQKAVYTNRRTIIILCYWHVARNRGNLSTPSSAPATKQRVQSERFARNVHATNIAGLHSWAAFS